MKTIYRSLGIAMLITAGLLVTGVITRAQDPVAPQTQMQPQTVTIKGNVTTVSETSITVVDSAKAETTIAIDANAKITKSAKAAKTTDIKANDAVEVVAAKGEGSALTAVTIKVG